MIQTIAFVFPGQGSQSVKMMADLALHYSSVRHTFDIASTILGYDLWQLTQEGPEEKLGQTEYTQPALLTASFAAWQVYIEAGGKRPDFLAGHSLGEYTAWLCAEAMTFHDAVKLVARRGQLMQKALTQKAGGMAAIVGLSDEEVNILCQEAAQGEVVAPANYNSPGQVVIAGYLTAVHRAMDLAKAKGAKLIKLLPVSIPSHCVLMAEAAAGLKEALDRIVFSQPTIPVVNNVDVVVNKDANKIREGLIQQLTHPVRWVETVRFLIQQGVQILIECGPGSVLTGLNKRIDREVKVKAYSDSASLADVLTCH